ncbi:MAG: oxidoreductase [Balneola sp.]|jgi:putative oxidoreductase|nr:oxidoreductase [Balneola sp.]MBE78207.1 oxidoreductase [Balneola sp.]|tara:strand:- start:117 stop:512 length:396 start_codon:yes stop_codon:yes gene_type:complete
MNNKNIAVLLLRIGVGIIFIVAGWGKLTGIEGVQGFFGNIGIPMAGFMAWVVALVEFVGGIMILIGYKVQVPGILLSITMLVAIFTVKMGGDGGFRGMRLEIILMLTSLALAMMSTGSYSLDSMLNKPSEE